jgi:hypothetical protein
MNEIWQFIPITPESKLFIAMKQIFKSHVDQNKNEITFMMPDKKKYKMIVKRDTELPNDIMTIEIYKLITSS